jgi:hypothetical protein|eukprot:30897-Pelagococcus_subviridis.AAC.34
MLRRRNLYCDSFQAVERSSTQQARSLNRDYRDYDEMMDKYTTIDFKLIRPAAPTLSSTDFI